MAAVVRPVQARPKGPSLRDRWAAFRLRATRWLTVLVNWVITLALLGLLGLAGWGLWQKLQVPVTHIVVQGAVPEASAEWVRRELTPMIGKDIWQVDINAVQARLLKNTWLTAANVRRVWPDTLAVEIAIHHPIARWQGDHLLDADGSVFQPNGMSLSLVDTQSLPNLSGPDGQQWAVWERYLSIKPALAAEGLNIMGLIENSRGSFEVILQGGTKIRLGTEQIESRLQRLLDVYQKILADKLDQIAVIDLRYTNGFAVQWRDPPAAPATKK